MVCIIELTWLLFPHCQEHLHLLNALYNKSKTERFQHSLRVCVCLCLCLSVSLVLVHCEALEARPLFCPLGCQPHQARRAIVVRAILSNIQPPPSPPTAQSPDLSHHLLSPPLPSRRATYASAQFIVAGLLRSSLLLSAASASHGRSASPQLQEAAPFSRSPFLLLVQIAGRDIPEAIPGRPPQDVSLLPEVEKSEPFWILPCLYSYS